MTYGGVEVYTPNDIDLTLAKLIANNLKQIEVVPIDDVSIIVIIVTDKGHVEHKSIKLQDVPLEEVKKKFSILPYRTNSHTYTANSTSADFLVFLFHKFAANRRTEHILSFNSVIIAYTKNRTTGTGFNTFITI